MVGVLDERMGEEICACISLVEGQECTEEEIKAYCKGQVRRDSGTVDASAALLSSRRPRPSQTRFSSFPFQISHFKVPRYVLFRTSYPLTVTGKVNVLGRGPEWAVVGSCSNNL